MFGKCIAQAAEKRYTSTILNVFKMKSDTFIEYNNTTCNIVGLILLCQSKSI